MPGSGGSEALVRFEDVIVHFSREEWKVLKECQKELYWEVLKDTYNALLDAGGLPVTKSDVLAWVEQREHQNLKQTQKSSNGDSSGSSCESNDKLAEVCHVECTEAVGSVTVVHDRSKEDVAQHGDVGGTPEHSRMSGMQHESPVRTEAPPHTAYRQSIQGLARFAYSPRTVTVSKPHERGARGERFGWKGLPQTRQKISTKNVSFPCPECGMGFPSSLRLRMHWRVHMYVCTDRRKASPSLERGEPVPPQESRAGEKLHLCVLCGKSFQRYLGFLQHQKGHDEARPQPCAQCEAVFMYQSDLETHEERHLEEVMCVPAACGKNCLCSLSLQLHLASQLRKRAEISKTGLQSHEQLPQKAGREEEKLYSCGQCELQFKYEINLEAHNQYHHKDWLLKHQLDRSAQNSLLQRRKVPAQQACAPSAPSDGSEDFRDSCPLPATFCTLWSCSYCDKQFTSKFSLQKHQKRHKQGGSAKHGKKAGPTGGPTLAHASKKLHSCQECGKKFVYKWQLVSHRKGHAGEKPPLSLHSGNILEQEGGLCEHTKKRARADGKQRGSARAPALAENRRVREREQHCFCDECGKAVRKTYLPEHQAFHAGLRYKCRFCEKIYTFKSGAYHHLRRHWQNGDFPRCPEGGSRLCLCMVETIYVDPGAQQQQHALDRVPQPSEGFPSKSLDAKPGQSIVSSSHLDFKQLSHSRDKQGAQAELEKSRGWKSALKLFRNSSPRHFRCTDCGKDFAYKACLMMHRRTQHRAKQRFPCAECGKCFISSFYLGIHRKKHAKENV